MITVEVDPTRALLKVGRVDQATRAALRGVVVSLTKSLASLVRIKLSGQVLQKRTGRLYDSITSTMIENPSSVYGVVKTAGVPYARIHEFGGVIKHPGSSKFQAWQGPNGMVFTHGTRPHTIPMPERSYMRSSLAEMQDEIIARMTSAVRVAARAA